MKRFILIPLLLAVIARADEPISTLSFNDSTRITGAPLFADGEEQIMKITSPSLEGEVTIQTKGLLEVDLDNEYNQPASDHYALATIMKRHIDGPPLDSIRGRLVHLDDESITLETPYAGVLKLNRAMVQALDIYSQSPSFYSGPKGPEGWVSGDGDVEDYWTFTDGAMISKERSGIARQIELPEQSVIKFTVAWKRTPQFRILFLSNDGKTDYPGISYSLNVSQSYLNLNRTAGDQRNDLISESINNLKNSGSEMAEFSIYLDRNRDGTSAIYIGKDRIGSWTGMDDIKGMGDWLHFIPQQVNPMKFSKISISQWDGLLPRSPEDDEDPPEEDGEANEAGQRIKLANGDVVLGTIKAIEDDFVLATTFFGDVRIPVNRMSSIDLKGDRVLEEPRMWAEDIRAWFHEGGSITIRLDSLMDGKIKGSSQVFGEAEFDLNAFSRLEFNIWRRELDPERYGRTEDW